MVIMQTSCWRRRVVSLYLETYYDYMQVLNITSVLSLMSHFDIIRYLAMRKHE